MIKKNILLGLVSCVTLSSVGCQVDTKITPNNTVLTGTKDTSSDTELKLFSTLYDRVYDILTYSPQDKNSLFDRQTSLFQFMPIGTPINPNDYENALTPSNPETGDLAKAEAFSGFVNDIPALGLDYVPTTTKVESVYQTIVTDANTTETIDPVQKKNYEDAYNYLNTTVQVNGPNGNIQNQVFPSEIYKTYLENKKNYNNALSSYRTAYNNYNMSDSVDQRKWIAQEPSLQSNLDDAWDEWRSASAGLVEDALNTMQTSGNSVVKEIFSRDKQSFSKTSLPSITQGLPYWHLSYALPSDWFSDKAAQNFTDLTIKKSTLNSNASHLYTDISAHSGINFGGWTFGSSGKISNKTQYNSSHIQTTDITLHFKLGVVRIMRPWLDGQVFNLPNWSFSSNVLISSGNLNPTDQAKALMPLIPVSFIVARDIQITGKWSDDEKKSITSQVEGKYYTGFGPFCLSGVKGSADGSYQSERAKLESDTITVPGIQVIGWISQIVPKNPPVTSTNPNK